MSERATRVIEVNISSGILPTFEAARKEADAIKIWLIRFCKKKGYSVKAAIGASMNNPHTGHITTKKTGRRGRPATVFVRTREHMRPTETEPHIHMIIYANPASTVVEELMQRINKKFHKAACRKYYCEDYLEEAVNYLFKQSKKVRMVDYDPSGILNNDDLGFCQLSDEASQTYRGVLAFTKSEAASTPETLDSTAVSDVSETPKELVCNSLINTTTDIIYSLFNTTTLIRDVLTSIKGEREDKKDIEDTTSNNSSIKIKEDKTSIKIRVESSLLQRCIDTIHTLYSHIQKSYDKTENIHISSIHCMNIVPDEENPDFPP